MFVIRIAVHQVCYHQSTMEVHWKLPTKLSAKASHTHSEAEGDTSKQPRERKSQKILKNSFN